MLRIDFLLVSLVKKTTRKTIKISAWLSLPMLRRKIKRKKKYFLEEQNQIVSKLKTISTIVILKKNE